ncbi:MAG TPA: outer membrane lipoprotein chaperone LolA [Thiotrichaceae bacterium]|nr:outer membrane lipoprotein chaperone LolA [Thiotrichaceae bacterium]
MKKLLLTLLLASLSTVSFAETEARKQLNRFFTSVNTIQGSFVQQLYGKNDRVKETVKGHLVLQRPGKFRWVYKHPDPQQIVADGKNIWMYDQDLDQVTVKPLKNMVRSSPAIILIQNAAPDSQFKVMEMDDKTSGWNWFYLTPHRKQDDFTAIQMGMDNKGNLRQMVLYDKIGQKTVITFNTSLNRPVNAEQFRFVVPAGVDVIGTPI